jgi:hypothetical protein
MGGTLMNAVGTGAIRLAEKFVISTRLEAMSLNFPHLDDNSISNIERIYSDVLELCRCALVLPDAIKCTEGHAVTPIRPGFYNNNVRREATRLLFLQISNGQTRHLVKALLEWPEVEMSLFFSEILLCLPSEWTG